MIVAQWIVLAATAWALAGGLTACAFLLWGIDRIDPGARHAYANRPLLIPGIILLWPLVIARWILLEKGT